MNSASLLGHILELLQITDTRQQPADRVVATFFRERSYLGAKDRRAISEDLFGIIRNRRYIEALIERYVYEHPEVQRIDLDRDRYLTVVTVFSFAQRFRREGPFPESSWKRTFPEIDLRHFTDWLKRNEDLSFLQGGEKIRMGVYYSFQDWMIDEWETLFGVDLEKFLESMNTAASTALRVNSLKSSSQHCRNILSDDGIESTPSTIVPDGLIAAKRFNVQGTRAFKDGLFEVQDVGSQLVSIIANPSPGMTVIDACAGAGGKSLHLAALMKNEGEIIAMDVDGKRLLELSRRAERAGARIVRTQLRGDMNPENFLSKADIVLVDAPCSGSGTIRRNPWLKWSITESLVQHFASAQAELLSFNAKFVRPGGVLVYATCSLFRKENDEVVEKFLASHPEFGNVTGENPHAGRSATVMTGIIRLSPHVHQTDGFTIFILRRHGNA